MGDIRDQAGDVYRDFEQDGVAASGLHEPIKAEIRALFETIDLAVAAAQAGVAIVADTAARDTFFADADNQGKLVYVNNNNGDDEDPENGVYEYVGGAPRIATGFYQGLAAAVQPLVDDAEAAAVAAAASAADAAAVIGDIDIQVDVEMAGWKGVVITEILDDDLEYVVLGTDDEGKTYPAASSGVDSANGAVFAHATRTGQSNRFGNDATAVSITAGGCGSVMPARGIQTWAEGDNAETPASRAAGDFSLVDMVEDTLETGALAFADGLKLDLLELDVQPPYRDVTAGPVACVTSVALGGRFAREYLYFADTSRGVDNGHHATLLDDVTRLSAIAASAGYRYLYMGTYIDGGESEGTDNGGLQFRTTYGGTLKTASQMIADYGADLADHADQHDADIRAILGDTIPRPTFATPANYPMVHSAHRVAKAASDLFYVVGPRFYMPSARATSNGLAGASQAWGPAIHISPDAQRWRSEMERKVGRKVVLEGQTDWDALHLVSATKTGANTVRATFHVPEPPLVIDVETWAKVMGFGFLVYSGSADSPSYPSNPYASAAVLVGDGSSQVDFTFPSIPAGASLMAGYSARCDLGVSLGTITSVAPGAASAAGFATENVTVDVNLSAVLGPLLNDEVFELSNTAQSARMIVRGVSYGAGTTTFTGETRERTGTFSTTQGIYLFRTYAAVNLRDSDPELGKRRFLAGPRAGDRYPLWNVCMMSHGVAIADS